MLFSALISLLIRQRKGNAIGLKITICKREVVRHLIIFLSAITPLLVSALRYGIGTDYFYTYIPQFNKIINGERNYYEIGFYYFNKFIGIFTSNGHAVIIITSIIFIGIVYREIYRYSRQYWLSIILFYLSFVYFISLNNIRQSMASALLLIAIELLIQKKRIGFAFCVLIATSIHQIAVLFLLALAIEKICVSAMTYTVITIGFWCTCKFIMPIVLSTLINYVPRLKLYFVADEMKIYNEKTIGRLLIIIQFIIMLYLDYIEFTYKPDKDNAHIADKREWNIIKLNQFLLVCVYAVDGIVPAAYRIARVFSFSQFIFIPNVIFKYEKHRKRRWLQVLLTISLFGILFVKNIHSGAEEVFPYRSIFDFTLE